MPATLPARANLEYLKKQSKDLHRAFAEGEADAVDRIRRCLPRAGRLDESQLPGMDLSLQETQHALACEYGFGKWEELVAAVEAPGFEDLARLNDRETQILMREVDQNALVRALVGAAGPVVERFLQNMSERVRGFIETEIHSTGDLSAEEVAAARAGLVEQVRALPLTGSCGRRESRQGHHRWHPHLPTIRDLPASTVR